MAWCRCRDRRSRYSSLEVPIVTPVEALVRCICLYADASIAREHRWCRPRGSPSHHGARIAVECRLQVFGVLGAIHEQLAVHVSVALEEDQHQLWGGKKRRVIGGRAGRAAGKAARFKIVSTLCGRARRNQFFSAQGSMNGPSCLMVRWAVPDSAEIRVAIGHMGTGPGGPGGGGTPGLCRQSEPRPALTPTQRQARIELGSALLRGARIA